MHSIKSIICERKGKMYLSEKMMTLQRHSLLKRWNTSRTTLLEDMDPFKTLHRFTHSISHEHFTHSILRCLHTLTHLHHNHNNHNTKQIFLNLSYYRTHPNPRLKRAKFNLLDGMDLFLKQHQHQHQLQLQHHLLTQPQVNLPKLLS